MQVRNQIAIGWDKNKPFRSSRKDLKNDVAFGKETVPLQTKEEKKETHYIKTATNVLGVALWIGVVGYSVRDLKMLRPNHPESVLRKIKNTRKQWESYQEKLADKNNDSIDKLLEKGSFKGIRKFFYKLGEGFQDAKMKLGGELFNNLLYAIGTLVVMPIVVLFSPFGKKNSSKEDKTFAILRQPLSVAATLGMQYTFDKMIDKYVPEIIKQNHLESKSILKDGKIILKDEKGHFLHKNYEKIKYNSDEAKEGFKLWNNSEVVCKTANTAANNVTDTKKQGIFNKIWNVFKDKYKLENVQVPVVAEKLVKQGILSDDEIKELFTLASFEEESATVYKEKLKNILNNKYEKQGLHLNYLVDFYRDDDIEGIARFKEENPQVANDIKKLLNKFKKFTEVLDNNKMAGQKYKTWVNVLAASAIGCTFLNVIYGKSMKAWKNHKSEQLALQNEKSKEVK